jgi:hypothetical protein
MYINWVSKLRVLHIQNKVWLQYIQKYIALHHSVTNKIQKDLTDVMNHTQNKYSLIISLINPYNLWGPCFTFSPDFCVESCAVADAAYSVQWYNHSTKFKKMLQMVIMRDQSPCVIHVGPIFPLTMEHVQKVSQISLYNFMIFI